jgi:hypothetical protein
MSEIIPLQEIVRNQGQEILRLQEELKANRSADKLIVDACATVQGENLRLRLVLLRILLQLQRYWRNSEIIPTTIKTTMNEIEKLLRMN